MSGFDISVWSSNTTLTVAQAAEIRDHVGRDWIIFANDPSVESFLAALRSRYPDFSIGGSAKLAQWGPSDPFLQSVDDPRPPPPTPAQLRDYQYVRATVWNGAISQQGLYLSMSILWDHAAEVFPYVQTLAKTHHLTVLDEDNDLQQPQSPTMAVPNILHLSLTLHIAGRAPALDASVTEGSTTLAHRSVPTRLDAHKWARTLATARHEIGYHLDDPRCLAQAYVLVPVETGIALPPFPGQAQIRTYELKRRDGH